MSGGHQENKTGLPDRLKAGVETLSGLSMDDVSVHYKSPKPAQLAALAYTQGTEIHVGPGQERHLPHEAWHVVQQKQGRVKPTMWARSVAINDDQELEKEADVMGTKAIQKNIKESKVHNNSSKLAQRQALENEPAHGVNQSGRTVQRWQTQPMEPVLQAAASGVIQLDAAQNLQILKSVPAAQADGSYTAEGNKDNVIKECAGDKFIIPNTPGTWHHIYPRNRLKTNLENISKYFVATNGNEVQMTETKDSSHKQMLNMAQSFSMNSAGRLTKSSHYYWKHGNGFVGIRSDYRSDDPGSLVEHEKPAGMNSGGLPVRCCCFQGGP